MRTMPRRSCQDASRPRTGTWLRRWVWPPSWTSSTMELNCVISVFGCAKSTRTDRPSSDAVSAGSRSVDSHEVASYPFFSKLLAVCKLSGKLKVIAFICRKFKSKIKILRTHNLLCWKFAVVCRNSVYYRSTILSTRYNKFVKGEKFWLSCTDVATISVTETSSLSSLANTYSMLTAALYSCRWNFLNTKYE